jgi:hypothetical protein
VCFAIRRVGRAAEGTGLLNRHSGNTIVSSNLTLSAKYGLVVQLVRVPACHAGRCGFESRPDRQVVCTVRLTVRTQAFHACNRGSIPLQCTKFNL